MARGGGTSTALDSMREWSYTQEVQVSVSLLKLPGEQSKEVPDLLYLRHSLTASPSQGRLKLMKDSYLLSTVYALISLE